MPKLNLGRVRFNWRGTYDPLVDYLEYDCVEDDGQSYVCIAPVTGTGPNETGGGTYWGSMLIRSADYNAARDQAVQAASDAEGSATASSQSATTAGQAQAAAEEARDKAQAWASQETGDVEPGLKSAKQYAEDAASFGDPNQFSITADQTSDTRTSAEWMAAFLATQQKAIDNTTAISDTEPDPTFAYQRWWDTSGANPVLKLRNAANTGWHTLGAIADGQWIPYSAGQSADDRYGNFVANDPRVKAALNALGDAPIYACRAWVKFNGIGAVSAVASGNVSSITDLGAGDYVINFATAMPDADYGYTFGATREAGESVHQILNRNRASADSATSMRVQMRTASGTPVDRDGLSAVVFR